MRRKGSMAKRHKGSTAQWRNGAKAQWRRAKSAEHRGERTERVRDEDTRGKERSEVEMRRKGDKERSDEIPQSGRGRKEMAQGTELRAKSIVEGREYTLEEFPFAVLDSVIVIK